MQMAILHIGHALNKVLLLPYPKQDYVVMFRGCGAECQQLMVQGRCQNHRQRSGSGQSAAHAPVPQVLKDIIVKYQLLAGRRAKYVPGWDCHGLPIELKVLLSSMMYRYVTGTAHARSRQRGQPSKLAMCCTACQQNRTGCYAAAAGLNDGTMAHAVVASTLGILVICRCCRA